MYDINLNKNEKILLISDETIIKDHIYSSVITNQRLIILDYPSSYHNSQEELRILNKMNYIKMKEIIYESSLKNIKTINNNQIIYNDNTDIVIKDDNVINKLKELIIVNK